MLATKAKLIRISDNEFRVSGTAEYFVDKTKYVTVDGERYSNFTREIVNYNLDEMYEKGGFEVYEMDFFQPVFDVLKVYYPKGLFSIFSRFSSVTSAADIVHCTSLVCECLGICRGYDLNRSKMHYSFGKGTGQYYNMNIESIVKHNSFPFKLFDYSTSTSFCIYMSYQMVLSYGITDKIAKYYQVKSLYKMYQPLFLPVNNEIEKVDRLLLFNDLMLQLTN
jgi:hypothetical protein